MSTPVTWRHAPRDHRHDIGDVDGLEDALGEVSGFGASEIGDAHLDDVKSPGVHWQSFSASATEARGYPYPRAGHLIVTANDSGSQVSQRYLTFDATANIRMSVRNFHQSWDVWRDIPLDGQDTGGGVSPDHPLLYQSGTRDIASHVADGWAVAARGTTITRQGATVTLSLDVTRTGAPIVPPAEQGEGDITYATVLTLPAGFTPIAAGFISPAKAGTGDRPEGWFDRSGATFRIRDMAATLPTGTRITNVITWQTIDPIPA